MKCPVAHWAREAPARPALVFEGSTWTYRDLDRQVSHWSAILADRGVRKGARVALLLNNRAESVALTHACARRGAASVPLNVRLTSEELRPLIRRLAPQLVIAEEQLGSGLEDVQFLELLEHERSRLAPLREEGLQLDPEAVFAILFTSGTSGAPRAAELTLANFAASARASGLNLGSDPEQRWLACLPLFHVGGLAMLTRCAWYGACLILHRQFREDEVNESLQRGEATHVSLVETTLARLLSARGALRFPASVRGALVGGGPVAVELLQRAKALGMPALRTYGLTETTSQVATERLADADGLTAGPALSGLSLRIVEPLGIALPSGEIGEIQVRGPTLMRGYFGDDRATAEVFSEGWLKTGDLGSLDSEGRLTVLARRMDLIISGGENIYPVEIENVLKLHPAVEDAAVVGEASRRWGSSPVGIIVARDIAPDPAQLESWCRVRLAGFKVPKRFVFLPALPRNAMGKVDRGLLAQLVNK